MSQLAAASARIRLPGWTPDFWKVSVSVELITVELTIGHAPKVPSRRRRVQGLVLWL
jgi:hypothetical protein